MPDVSVGLRPELCLEKSRTHYLPTGNTSLKSDYSSAPSVDPSIPSGTAATGITIAFLNVSFWSFWSLLQFIVQVTYKPICGKHHVVVV